MHDAPPVSVRQNAGGCRETINGTPQQPLIPAWRDTVCMQFLNELV
jgi:hypothetical protein